MSDILIPYGGGAGADLDLVTASEADVRRGKVFVDRNGNPITGNMAEKASATYNPGTFDQTIAANQYLTGVQTIKGDPNLLAQYIKKGVTIFGVAGTWEGYITGPADIYNRGTWGSGTNGRVIIGIAGTSAISSQYANSAFKNCVEVEFIKNCIGYTKLNVQYTNFTSGNLNESIFFGSDASGVQSDYYVSPSPGGVLTWNLDIKVINAGAKTHSLRLMNGQCSYTRIYLS